MNNGYTFEPKTVTLVANTAQTITWSTPEFYKHLVEAPIMRPVSVRFKVTNNTTNVVYLSLSYETLDYSVPLQERKSLAGVAASTTLELSKATVPAIGALLSGIQSISISLIGAVAGTVSVVLVIDRLDELTASGNMSAIGQDSPTTDGYLQVSQFSNQICNASSNNTLVDYTVPAGKRFYLDYVAGSIPPVGSFSGVVTWTLYMPDPTIMYIAYNQLENDFSFVAVQAMPFIFSAGQRIHVDAFNGHVSALIVAASLFGREVF